MALETWILYLFAASLLCVTPGPNTLLALVHGASHGVQRTVFTCLGGALGFTLVIAVCMAGLGALLTASATMFTILKWVGAAYLVYLGIVTWRAPPITVRLSPEHRTASARTLFSHGFMAAASNPKGIVFFAAFLPQFIDPARSQITQFLVLAATFIVIEFVYELFLAGSANRLAPWLGRKKVGRWLNRGTGVVFVGMGGLLAAANR